MNRSVFVVNTTVAHFSAFVILSLKFIRRPLKVSIYAFFFVFVFLICLFVCFINKRICLIPKFALTRSKQTKSRDLSQFRIPDFHHQRFQNLGQKSAIARLLILLILREEWVW